MKPKRSHTQLPMIDISLVTFNSEKWLQALVDSIVKQDYPLGKINLYINDCASTDQTVKQLHLLLDGCGFHSVNIHTSDNVGFGAGQNLNVAKGRSEFVLVINPDLEIEPTAITTAVAFAMQDDAKVGSWEFRQKPYEHPKLYSPFDLTTTWSSSACILFRRTAFEEAGGYDNNIFLYCEDVDLSWRLRAHGYTLKYLPKAVCWHHTYSESKFKETQFIGSIIGNLSLRARFGTDTDVKAGEELYKQVTKDLKKSNPTLLKSLVKAKKSFDEKLPQFSSNNKKFKKSGVAKFVDWEYENIRLGAFYELQTNQAEHKKVSIIVRTYRGRLLHLKNALASALNQTHPNFEIIVVEDGGNTYQSYIDGLNEPRIKYYSLPKVGRCVTGNFALSVSQCDYICFLDDDDFLYCDHLETLLNALAKSPEHQAAYAAAFMITSDSKKNQHNEISKITEDTPYTDFFKPFDLSKLLIFNLTPIQGMVFSRSLYDRFGGFTTHLDNLEDWDLWVRFTQATDFLSIEKTTSAFRIPKKTDENDKRQHLLDNYYEKALVIMKNYRFYGKNYYDIRSMLIKSDLPKIDNGKNNQEINISDNDPTFNNDLQHYIKCGLELATLIKILSLQYSAKTIVDLSPQYGRMTRHLVCSKKLNVICATDNKEEASFLTQALNIKCSNLDYMRQNIDCDLAFMIFNEMNISSKTNGERISVIKQMKANSLLLVAHMNNESEINRKKFIRIFNNYGYDHLSTMEKFWDNSLDVSLMRKI